MTTLEERLDKVLYGKYESVSAAAEAFAEFIKTEIEQAKLEAREEMRKISSDGMRDVLSLVKKQLPKEQYSTHLATLYDYRSYLLSHLQSPVAPESPTTNT